MLQALLAVADALYTCPKGTMTGFVIKDLDFYYKDGQTLTISLHTTMACSRNPGLVTIAGSSAYCTVY
jgi:hypothetical protein